MLVARIDHGDLVDSFESESSTEEDLVVELRQKYPDLEEILLNGFNFAYINNKSHWQAAGYGDGALVDGYKALYAPAHFNRTFFQILR